MRSIHLRSLIYTALFAGCAVLVSGIHFPVGPTKVFPFQHTVNVLAGIVLGPWYGALAAFLAGIIRISIGTGTIFAIPGGIPGALVVGLMYRVFKSDWVALTEPIGTGPIGATLSALIVAPLIGKTGTWLFFQSAFLASSIPGSIIGLVLVKSLRKVVNLDVCYEGSVKKC
ncbi:energy coupling factor transporter S component ThiW [Thermatribacter velox]|jgi:energy coupling factor transporter S component ThiW|uniref:Energy coupling factor transporter S component ThiW n=1 Tax=Thermatribacter velox TaxID=3039681 RepID=A0ABZ2Y8U9_9BACT